MKNKLGYDDSLDAFGVHGIGGTIGALLTGIFASSLVAGVDGSVEQFTGQLVSVIVTQGACHGSCLRYWIKPWACELMKSLKQEAWILANMVKKDISGFKPPLQRIITREIPVATATG